MRRAATPCCAMLRGRWLAGADPGLRARRRRADSKSRTLKDLQKREVRDPHGRAVGCQRRQGDGQLSPLPRAAEDRPGAARRSDASPGRSVAGERRAGAHGSGSRPAWISAAPRRSGCTRCCCRRIRTIRAMTRCSTSWHAPTRPRASRRRRWRRWTKSCAAIRSSREIAEVQFRRGELLFSAQTLSRCRACLCRSHRPGRRRVLPAEPVQAGLVPVQADR